MAAPVLSNGAVVLRGGRIEVVGPAPDLRAAYPDAAIHDYGDAVLLPGLVNAHTHLELSKAHPGAVPAGGFTGWLLERVRQAASTPAAADDGVPRAMARGIEQCIGFGVTTVGDITRSPANTRPRLTGSPLRAVSFGEVRAMAQNRALLEAQVAAALNPADTSPRVVAGVSPHAPYSVEPEGFRRCLAAALERGFVLATHLAESPHEAEFLAGHTGPFRELWEALGRWDGNVPTFAGGPIRFAQSLGLLDVPSVLAHVNYCDDAELDLLAAGRASVVYCPRTHAYFGHPPHRWRDMLSRGINVAVGTDSCASSPDLNLADDLRLLHRLAPEVPAAALWEMATVRAARALGLLAEVGTLEAGKAGDVVAFPVRRGMDNPLPKVLEDGVAPLSVWLSAAGHPDHC